MPNFAGKSDAVKKDLLTKIFVAARIPRFTKLLILNEDGLEHEGMALLRNAPNMVRHT
jgi:hypothetical protein